VIAYFFELVLWVYLAGFVSWFVWFVDFVVRWMLLGGFAGIFSGSGIYQIWFSLFCISYLFGCFGCFALSRQHSSFLAFSCGLFYLTVAGPFGYSLYLPYGFFHFLRYGYWFMVSAQIFWGASLVSVRKFSPLPHLSSSIGWTFVVLGFIGGLLWPPLGFWGFEMWLALLGWICALGAVATAVLLLRLAKK